MHFLMINMPAFTPKQYMDVDNHNERELMQYYSLTITSIFNITLEGYKLRDITLMAC